MPVSSNLQKLGGVEKLNWWVGFGSLEMRDLAIKQQCCIQQEASNKVIGIRGAIILLNEKILTNLQNMLEEAICMAP